MSIRAECQPDPAGRNEPDYQCGGGDRGGNAGTVFITTRVQEFREPIEHQAPAGTYGCLEVRDNGCGMEESTVARIFDPFFSTKFTGEAWELAAALGIIHGHGEQLRSRALRQSAARFPYVSGVQASGVSAPNGGGTESRERCGDDPGCG